MKNYYIITFLALMFLGAISAQEQQKNFINYQGVARDAENTLMEQENLEIGISLKFGSASSTSVYAENHSVATDANGVFSLKIGNGATVSGDYNNLPWGTGATFVTVSINGNEIGTTEMMAVPYAITSGDGDDQSAAEVPYSNTTSGLTATTAQGAIDELATGGRIDTDADPTNEIQTLSFDSGTNELSLSDGNSVVISSGGTDADADPTNEIQTISFDAAANKITLTDGGEITIPSGGTDADADPSNEFQTLSFDAGTNELSLSDGNSVIIPSGSTDADADPTNELQDISLSGTELTITDGSTIDLAPIVPPGGTDDQNLILTGDILSIENGSGSVDLSTYAGDDADADPTNELQDISLSGTDLSISDGSTLDLSAIIPTGGTDDQNLTFDETTNILEIEDGNTVDLSSLASGGGGSLWIENGSDIHFNSGKVGIGTDSPSVPFHIISNTSNPTQFETKVGSNWVSYFTSNGYIGYSGVYTNSQDMDFGTGSSNTTGKVHLTTGSLPKLTVAANGDVGIGTTNPTAKLDVRGNIKTSSEINTNATGTANMIPIAYGRIASSGAIVAGSNNFTVTRNLIGRYDIIISGVTIEQTREMAIVATRVNFSTPPGFIGGGSGLSGGNPAIIVFAYNIAGEPENISFSFVAYKQ